MKIGEVDTMLKIAICDDDSKEVEHLKNSIKKIEIQSNMEFNISEFLSGEALYENCKHTEYAIIFLDILMGGIDGIEVANRIQSLGSTSLIVFVSSFEERWKELFGLNAIAFLTKPFVHEELENTIQKAIQNIYEDKNKKMIFTYKKNRVMCYIPVVDIVYFLSNKNKIFIQTNTETIEYVFTMKELWSQLQEYDVFVMPNRSYICNLKHIMIRSNMIEFKHLDEAPISIGRKYKDDTYDRFYKYMEKRCD